MHSIVRSDFGGRNSGKKYINRSACAPHFQVISAVDNFISNTEKPPFLQKKDAKADQNAKRSYMDDGLVQDASVNN